MNKLLRAIVEYDRLWVKWRLSLGGIHVNGPPHPYPNFEIYRARQELWKMSRKLYRDENEVV